MDEDEKRRVTVETLTDTREAILGEKSTVEKNLLDNKRHLAHIKSRLLVIENTLKVFGVRMSQDQSSDYFMLTSVIAACKQFLVDNPGDMYKAMEVFKGLQSRGFKFQSKNGISAVYTCLSRLVKYGIAERHQVSSSQSVHSGVWHYSLLLVSTS